MLHPNPPKPQTRFLSIRPPSDMTETDSAITALPIRAVSPQPPSQCGFLSGPHFVSRLLHQLLEWPPFLAVWSNDRRGTRLSGDHTGAYVSLLAGPDTWLSQEGSRRLTSCWESSLCVRLLLHVQILSGPLRA